MPVLPLTMPP